MSVNMAWKDLADRQAIELKKANDTIARLRRKLAEQHPQQLANSQPGHGHPYDKQLQQFNDIQRELESVRAENDKLVRDTTSLDQTLQNTLAKYDKVNKDAYEENQALRLQLAAKNETLRKIQTTRVYAQSTSDQGQAARLKNDLDAATAENSILKRTRESLTRQLQAEKAENAKKIAFMRSDPRKLYEQDDEEPLPTEDAALKEMSREQSKMAFAEPAKKFKTLNIPDELKPETTQSKPQDIAAMTKRNDRAPTAKKHKRSAQEEIDEELAELDIHDFEMPTEPRRKRRNVYEGSYASDLGYAGFQPVEDSKYLPGVRTSKNTKINNRTKSTPAKKKSPVEPLTPMSPASPPALPEPVAAFTFKAVCTYKRDGAINDYYNPADLKPMADLWDRINVITTNWEDNKGEDWKWTFERRGYNPKTPACITSKLQDKRTKWHTGFEGIHACKDCAQTGRPCFTFVQLGKEGEWEYGEFRLLPLRESDRTRAVAKGVEIRHWVNDGTEMVEPDDGDEDMDWD
jgi:hypothetical protein